MRYGCYRILARVQKPESHAGLRRKIPTRPPPPEYQDEDLYAALRYAENDNKTDRKMFVGGINCSAQNAYAEMIAVQRRFGLRGKVVGYHGIQSFREGEVTPEQAF